MSFLNPEIDKEYNNRARVPEYEDIFAEWEREARAYRAARAGHAEIGLKYGSHPRQTIDLFRPDTPDPAKPLVLFIHGGYWRSLEPSLFSHFAAGANAHGYSVALPGYRLCPEVTVADVIEDVRAACLHLHRLAGPARFVACGHSAGGHLAACMLATNWAAHGAPARLVRHAFGISGVFDLAPLLVTSVNETLRLDLASAKAASPALWPAPAGTRFAAWVGAEESSEFIRQSELISEAWAAGAETRFEIIPAANHFTAPAPLADPASRMTQALVALAAAAALDPRTPVP